MTLTITIDGSVILAYLTVGALLVAPLLWWEYCELHNPSRSFARTMLDGVRSMPWVPLALVVLWPLAAWERVRGAGRA